MKSLKLALCFLFVLTGCGKQDLQGGLMVANRVINPASLNTLGTNECVAWYNGECVEVKFYPLYDCTTDTDCFNKYGE